MFAGLGAAAYVATLLATVPAAFLIPRGGAIAALGGTIWHGRAALAGGDRLEWRWAPLRTLANLRFAADFTVEGTGTLLAGRALLGSQSVRLDAVSGSVDAALLTAIARPGFTCAMPVQLDLERVVLGAGDRMIAGRAVSEAGSCTAGGATSAVPPLALSAEHLGPRSAVTLAPGAQRRRTLATMTLEHDGAATLSVTRDGAGLLPFAAPPAGMTVETRL